MAHAPLNTHLSLRFNFIFKILDNNLSSANFQSPNMTAAAQARQAKELINKIAIRKEQMVTDGAFPISRCTILQGNEEYGEVIELQGEARKKILHLKGAKTHYNTFQWEPKYLDTYKHMLETFINDPDGNNKKTAKKAERAAKKLKKSKDSKAQATPSTASTPGSL